MAVNSRMPSRQHVLSDIPQHSRAPPTAPAEHDMSEPALLLVPESKLVRQQHAPTYDGMSAPGASGDHYNPVVREVNIPKLASGACGFDLSRSKWDPYPWVSGIDKDSTAGQTGLRVGDCVLEVNGEDILGLRIAEVARLVRAKAENVTLQLWTNGMDPNCQPESLCCGPMPLNLERLSSCVQAILTALECPVCLDTIPPPTFQCVNGHLVCARCRVRADKCPVCRQRYSTARSLIAEQVYSSITDAFKLRDDEGKVREQLFGAQCRRSVPEENAKTVQSHTHKFLARILGKATSLDGLNKAPEKPKRERSRVEVAKQLSLSVNEIFRPNCSAPSSRSTSPHRLVPDLGSQTVLGTRRPRSHNVSVESLHQLNDDLDELRLDIPVHHKDLVRLFGCPVGCDCTEKMRPAQLQRHVSEVHRTPIVSFGVASVSVDFPPRRPFDNGCVILRYEDVTFWVRLISSEPGEYLLVALAQTDEAEAEKFSVETRVGLTANGNHDVVTRCSIPSLQSVDWPRIISDRKGIVLSADSKTNDIQLNIAIRSVD